MDIAGTVWSYVDTGGSVDPIVLLPGALGTCEVFFKQITALGERHRVVAVTYPGFVAPEALADGLYEFLDRLGLVGALLVGSSFASFWLQFFALRYPASIRKILLGNGFVDGEPLASMNPLFAASLVKDSTPEALIIAWRAIIASTPASELRDLQLDMLNGRQPAPVLQSHLRFVITAKPCPPLPISDAQIILLDCLDDKIITPAMREAVQLKYPNATRHSLASGGHYPHILNPEAYNALLSRYARQ